MANAKPIEQQTIRELRALATTLNLTGWSRMSKDRLQAFLRERISALVAAPDQVPDAAVLDAVSSEVKAPQRTTKKNAKNQSTPSQEITFSNPIAARSLDAINVAPQDSLTFNISVKTSAFVPAVGSNDALQNAQEKAPNVQRSAKKNAKTKKSAKSDERGVVENKVDDNNDVTPQEKSEPVAQSEQNAKPKKSNRSRATKAKAEPVKTQEDKTASKQEKQESTTAKSRQSDKREKSGEQAKEASAEANLAPKKPRRSSRVKSVAPKESSQKSSDSQQTLLPLETPKAQEDALAPTEPVAETKKNETDAQTPKEVDATAQKADAKKSRSARKSKGAAKVDEKTPRAPKQEDASVTTEEPSVTSEQGQVVEKEQVNDSAPTSDADASKTKPKRTRKSTDETKSSSAPKQDAKSDPAVAEDGGKDAKAQESTSGAKSKPTADKRSAQKTEEPTESVVTADDANKPETHAPENANTVDKGSNAVDDVAHVNVNAKHDPQEAARTQSSPVREALRRSKMLSSPKNLRDRLVLSVCDSFWLRADWEITTQLIDRVRSAMGRHWHASDPALRVYLVDKDDRNSGMRRELYADLIIRGGVENWYIPVENPPASYSVELGYLTRDKQFFTIISSNVVTTPQQFTREPFSRLNSAVPDDRLGLMTSREAWLVQRRHKLGSERFHSSRAFDSGFNSGSRFGAEFDQERDKFLFAIDAEIVIKGRVEPNARVTVKEEPIKVSHEGEFSVRFKLPERRHVYPVVAIDAKSGEKHTIILAVDRNTKTLETDYLESPID